jgi:hypothetical protein
VPLAGIRLERSRPCPDPAGFTGLLGGIAAVADGAMKCITLRCWRSGTTCGRESHSVISMDKVEVWLARLIQLGYGHIGPDFDRPTRRIHNVWKLMTSVVRLMLIQEPCQDLEHCLHRPAISYSASAMIEGNPLAHKLSRADCFIGLLKVSPPSPSHRWSFWGLLHGEHILQLTICPWCCAFQRKGKSSQSEYRYESSD